MLVGVCRITLLVPESHSLKERRAVLRSIKERVRNRFNVAIAEVSEGEYADSWQSAEIGFAVVSNERGHAQAMVQKIINFVEDLSMAKLVDDEQDYVQYGEERIGDPQAHWEPEEPLTQTLPARSQARKAASRSTREPPVRPAPRERTEPATPDEPLRLEDLDERQEDET